MPRFQYTVKRASEGVTEGVLEAESERAAVARLRDMGFFPITVEEAAPERSGGRRVTLRRRKLRLKDRNAFFRQLANLLQAGMPISRALDALRDQTEHEALRVVVEELAQAVHEGSSLAEALERHPRVFPPMHVSLVRAGEAGGMLNEVLWRIVTFGEQDEELRGKAFSAMIYPAFLTFVSFAAVFILMAFVFPNFIEVFEDFDARLPLPTRIVIGISAFMGTFWWLILAGLGLAIFGVYRYRNSAAGRRQIDRAVLRLPVFGSLALRFEMAKFARTLGTLFDNGVPVLNALGITAETLSNSRVRDEVTALRRRVGEGEGISAAMRHSEVFPPQVVNMLSSGEESGKLGEVTQRIAEAYEIEVDRAVKAATALLEPVIIVFMGVFVGFLVIAMLLPMLTLSGQIR